MQLLLFADDLVLVAESEEDTKRNVEVLSDVMAKWKMRIYKLVKAQDDGSTVRGWYLPLGCGWGKDIEEVQKTKYLRAKFNEGASYDDEIENRIGTATRMVEALR